MSVAAPKRRFTKHHDAHPERVRGLRADHPAVVEGRTLFPTRVFAADNLVKVPRLLISGINHRKLGSKVAKGPWRDMPIFTLSLEERATCPRSCEHWRSCYGNGAQLARRVEHGPALEQRLTDELQALQGAHPRGFVIRLHFLGDFYSTDYVAHWAGWLDTYPALHVFGYTAWPRASEIGAAVAALAEAQWGRFAVRNSVWAGVTPEAPAQAGTLWRTPKTHQQPEGFVCPATLGPKKDETCCGSCGLCWAPAMRDTRILFPAHGQF